MPTRRLGSLRRILVSVGLGATLVLGSTAAAFAGTWTHDDPAKDVVSTADDGETFDPAPGRAAGDIQRIAVSHMQSKLVLRLTLRQGLRSDGWAILERIRTPRATFALELFRLDGDAGIDLSRNASNEGVVPCRGIAVTYATRSVLITIPTRCLGNPSVVKVGAWAYTTDDVTLFYIDDAFRRGVSHAGPRLSPQIPRG